VVVDTLSAFDVDVSVGGDDWITVAKVTNNTIGGKVDVRVNPPACGMQYVRLSNIVGSTYAGYAEVVDVYVWGCAEKQ